MSRRPYYNRKYKPPRPYCYRCKSYGHRDSSHPCEFCLETHQSKHHLCPLCDQNGHSENQHCSFCRELHSKTCSTCDVHGHCSKEEHCSICSGYHIDAEHECSICSLLGHETSLDCIPHLAETNKDLEMRVSNLETTIETLLDKLRKLSRN